MNPIYQQMNFDKNGFLNSLNKLKANGGDPNQMIQEMLNSGKISQEQYNMARNRAEQIMQMLTPSAHR